MPRCFLSTVSVLAALNCHSGFNSSQVGEFVRPSNTTSNDIPKGHVLSIQPSKRQKRSFKVISRVSEEGGRRARLPAFDLARPFDETFAGFLVRARVLAEDEDLCVGPDLVWYHPLALVFPRAPSAPFTFRDWHGRKPVQTRGV